VRLRSTPELKVAVPASVYQRRTGFVSPGKLSLLYKSAKEAVPASLHDKYLPGSSFDFPRTPFRRDAECKSLFVPPIFSMSD
jgi:hypothetical protein